MAAVHLALALLLAMTTFSTFSISTAATRLRSRKPRPYLQPVSPGGYRIYIVLLETPAGSDDMDDAPHRAWHESFLPTKMTGDGQPRLRQSYTCVVNGFSALLTDDEVKRVLDKPGVVTAIPNRFRIQIHAGDRSTSPAVSATGRADDPHLRTVDIASLE